MKIFLPFVILQTYLVTDLLTYLVTGTSLINYALIYLFICLLTYLLTYSLTHPLTHSLIPWNRVLEKLTNSQLIKKFPTIHGTRRFITAFQRACNLSLS